MHVVTYRDNIATHFFFFHVNPGQFFNVQIYGPRVGAIPCHMNGLQGMGRSETVGRIHRILLIMFAREPLPTEDQELCL